MSAEAETRGGGQGWWWWWWWGLWGLRAEGFGASGLRMCVWVLSIIALRLSNSEVFRVQGSGL